MARKKKIQIEKFPGIPRGAEHVMEAVEKGDPFPRLTPQGAELLSQEPVVLHVNRRIVTDLETIRRQIAAIRATDGPIQFESFAEADDFDLEDDFGDFHSKWEIPADQPDDITVEQYLRFKETGELPTHLFPQDGNGGSQGGPASGGTSGAQPQSSSNVNPGNTGQTGAAPTSPAQ